MSVAASADQSDIVMAETAQADALMVTATETSGLNEQTARAEEAMAALNPRVLEASEPHVKRRKTSHDGRSSSDQDQNWRAEGKKELSDYFLSSLVEGINANNHVRVSACLLSGLGGLEAFGERVRLKAFLMMIVNGHHKAAAVLIKSGIDPQILCLPGGPRYLESVIKKGDWKMLRVLLKFYPGQSCRLRYLLIDMLHTSLRAGDGAATRVLLKGRILPSQAGTSGKTALDVAVHSIAASREICRLLSQPVSPHIFQAIARLIKAGADINQRLGASGSTLLHKAVELGYAEHISWLLSHGANPDLRNAEQQTARDLALAANDQAAIQALGAQVAIPLAPMQAAPDTLTGDPLHPGSVSLPQDGPVPGARQTTVTGRSTAKPAATSAATPAMSLFYAAARGRLSELRELINAERGDINCQDKQGFTPLMHAIINGHLEAALHLVSAGANPYIVQPGARASAFTIAAMKGQTDIIAALIRTPGFSDLKDIAGVEAMCAVVEHQQHAVVWQLRQAGVSPHTTGPSGKNAVMVSLMSPAARSNHALQRALM